MTEKREDFFSIFSFQWNDLKSPISAVNASHFLPCELFKFRKMRRSGIGPEPIGFFAKTYVVVWKPTILPLY